jgi:hypothetical protein
VLASTFGILHAKGKMHNAYKEIKMKNNSLTIITPGYILYRETVLTYRLICTVRSFGAPKN